MSAIASSSKIKSFPTFIPKDNLDNIFNVDDNNLKNIGEITSDKMLKSKKNVLKQFMGKGCSGNNLGDGPGSQDSSDSDEFYNQICIIPEYGPSAYTCPVYVNQPSRRPNDNIMRFESSFAQCPNAADEPTPGFISEKRAREDEESIRFSNINHFDRITVACNNMASGGGGGQSTSSAFISVDQAPDAFSPYRAWGVPGGSSSTCRGGGAARTSDEES
jgi:hypothetical protein